MENVQYNMTVLNFFTRVRTATYNRSSISDVSLSTVLDESLTIKVLCIAVRTRKCLSVWRNTETYHNNTNISKDW